LGELGNVPGIDDPELNNDAPKDELGVNGLFIPVGVAKSEAPLPLFGAFVLAPALFAPIKLDGLFKLPPAPPGAKTDALKGFAPVI